MNSCLDELISIGDGDFFSDLLIACMIIEDGIIVKCNEFALSFFALNDKKEIEKKSFALFLNSHPVAKVIEQLMSEISDNQNTASTIYKKNSGTYFLRVKRMQANRIFVAIQDRTFEKQYDELLLNKMQLESVSHLAAGVAHELRNPLSVIQGFIQLSNVTGNFKKYYRTILSEIKRMNHIIEDFLSIARKKVDKRHMTPHELLNSITALIHSECLLHNINFDYKLRSTEGYLYVNESMIKQVMLNLLRNSIEACSEIPKKCVFRLHAGDVNGNFIIVIEDNGPGMSEQVMAELGNPFYTTKDNGTGIGIPMCKKIIKEHDGIFEINSVQNKGTRITIQLPLVKKLKTNIHENDLKI